MDMKPASPARPMGRPRSFNADKALDRALQVFWRKGYEGTSLTDLTKAMGINRPSLYAAFGDKEALFRKVLDRYAEGPAAYAMEALKEPTALAVVERLLRESADLAGDRSRPPGCLLVQGGLACGTEAESIQRELTARRNAGEAALRQRLERARKEGDLPSDAKPADLARYLMTVLRGLAVESAGGATRAELRKVAEIALRAWPT